MDNRSKGGVKMATAHLDSLGYRWGSSVTFCCPIHSAEPESYNQHECITPRYYTMHQWII